MSWRVLLWVEGERASGWHPTGCIFSAKSDAAASARVMRGTFKARIVPSTEPATHRMQGIHAIPLQEIRRDLH